MKNTIRVGKPESSKFEDLTFPNTLYKYREANNFEHRTIITKQIAYFASPDSFEDTLDCKIPIRYDLLNEDEIHDLYHQILKEQHPEWDSIYLREQTILWTNKWFLRNEQADAEFEEYYWKELNQRLGIFCLTAEAENISLWKKYGDNLNGFCIGFNPRMMFSKIGGGGKVNYFDILPIIKATDTIEYKIIVRTFSKLREWEFEKEYRTQKFWPSPVNEDARKFKIPKSAYSELIVGENVEKKKPKRNYCSITFC